MDSADPAVIPRSLISIGLDPALRRSFAQSAAGRVLVIDYFASRRCSVVIGDLTCQFRAAAPAGDFVELAPIDEVRVFIEARLRATLADSRPDAARCRAAVRPAPGDRARGAGALDRVPRRAGGAGRQAPVQAAPGKPGPACRLTPSGSGGEDWPGA